MIADVFVFGRIHRILSKSRCHDLSKESKCLLQIYFDTPAPPTTIPFIFPQGLNAFAHYIEVFGHQLRGVLERVQQGPKIGNGRDLTEFSKA